MNIFIFDKNLKFKGILDSYISFIWHRKYSRHGEFEIHISLTMEALKLLGKESLIIKGKEVGFIDYRKMIQNNDGSETLLVKGKMASAYLARRIIWFQKNINGTIEEGIRTLIDENAVNPVNVDRKIEAFTLGPLNGFTQTINKQVTYKNLLEEVENLALVGELGLKVEYENEQLVFKMYEGIDRTTNQSINSPAIFAREFENVLTQEYEESTRNLKNTALIAGEGEGAARILTTIENGTGKDRFELYVDARDLQQEEMTAQEYEVVLQSRGQSNLAEYTESGAFESEVDTNSNLTYKKDFDLGDKVTCLNKKWNIILHTRITEVKEIYENDGFKLEITFGNRTPTLTEKIKQEVHTWQ